MQTSTAPLSLDERLAATRWEADRLFDATAGLDATEAAREPHKSLVRRFQDLHSEVERLQHLIWLRDTPGPRVLTARQIETLEILRRLESRETFPNRRSYAATCFDCTPTNEHDHRPRALFTTGSRGHASDPELVKTFASADGTRAFVLNHAGHRTSFSLR